MSKTKNDYLNELVLIAFEIDRKGELQDQMKKDYQEMALLARKGLNDSPEFKNIMAKYQHPTVVDFGDDFIRLRKVVKYLRKFRFV